MTMTGSLSPWPRLTLLLVTVTRGRDYQNLDSRLTLTRWQCSTIKVRRYGSLISANPTRVLYLLDLPLVLDTCYNTKNIIKLRSNMIERTYFSSYLSIISMALCNVGSIIFRLRELNYVVWQLERIYLYTLVSLTLILGLLSLLTKQQLETQSIITMVEWKV